MNSACDHISSYIGDVCAIGLCGGDVKSQMPAPSRSYYSHISTRSHIWHTNRYNIQPNYIKTGCRQQKHISNKQTNLTVRTHVSPISTFPSCQIDCPRLGVHYYPMLDREKSVCNTNMTGHRVKLENVYVWQHSGVREYMKGNSKLSMQMLFNQHTHTRHTTNTGTVHRMWQCTQHQWTPTTSMSLIGKPIFNW